MRRTALVEERMHAMMGMVQRENEEVKRLLAASRDDEKRLRALKEALDRVCAEAAVERRRLTRSTYQQLEMLREELEESHVMQMREVRSLSPPDLEPACVARGTWHMAHRGTSQSHVVVRGTSYATRGTSYATRGTSWHRTSRGTRSVAVRLMALRGSWRLESCGQQTVWRRPGSLLPVYLPCSPLL